MNIWKTFLGCYWVLFLMACTSPNKSGANTEVISSLPYVIDLTDVQYSEEPQLLSEFVDSISYIRLPEDPLLPDRCGIVVDDDAMYIENDFIYKYALDGKFIKSLFKSGLGPAEVVKCSKAAYDLQNKRVMVNNNKGLTYRIYSLDGVHLGDKSKFDVDKNNQEVMSCMGDKMIYYCVLPYPVKGEFVNYDGAYFTYVKDLNTDSIIYKQPNVYYNIKVQFPGRGLSFSSSPFNYGMIDSVFWWKHRSIDTIYCTSDFETVRPWYILKKKSSWADYEYIAHAIFGDVENRRAQIKFCNPVGSGVIYCVNNGEESGFGFCRANEKAKTYSLKLFENDIDAYLKDFNVTCFLGLGSSMYIKNGYLYVLIEASEFFKEGAKPPFPDLTEESNPVVVKFKLKKG